VPPEAKPLTVPIQWNIEFDEPEGYEPSSIDSDASSALPRNSLFAPPPSDAPTPPPNAGPPGGPPSGGPSAQPSPPSPFQLPVNPNDQSVPVPLDADAPPPAIQPTDTLAEQPKKKGRFGRGKAASKKGKKGAASQPESAPSGPGSSGSADAASPWKLDDVFGGDSP
jgi:hypothetical protein